MTKLIDINCDVGESYGRYHIGNDTELIPLISSCNIACGWHGGDAVTIENAVALAAENGVRIGAHPSYPDLSGFGRRYMKMARADLASAMKYQVSAIKGIAESYGTKVAYVKPHGALYNRIAFDREEALCVYQALAELDRDMAVMGLAGSPCAMVAAEVGNKFIAEAFADRAYDNKGQLVSRMATGAVITDPESAAAQALEIARGRVISIDGTHIDLRADSICVHGDNPAATEIVKAIKVLLQKHQIRIGHE